MESSTSLLSLQPEEGPSIPLSTAHPTVIGRKNQNHIVNPCFSRRHLELHRSANQVSTKITYCMLCCDHDLILH